MRTLLIARILKFTLALCLFVLVASGHSLACTITTVPVSFTNYDRAMASPADATGFVRVTCDPGIPFTVRLDPGQHSGNTFTPRKMRHSTHGDDIEYNLFRDSARTEIWGDGTSSTFVQIGVGTGAESSFTVYGRIPPRQNVRVGFYGDSITVTVAW
jgi:spore coat protein U-like protein